MSKNLAPFYADLKLLMSHLFWNQETAIRKWSQEVCPDYQIPLALIANFFVESRFHWADRKMHMLDTPTRRAVRDIMTKSHLRDLVEVDAQNVLRFRPEVSEETIIEISDFVNVNSPSAIE